MKIKIDYRKYSTGTIEVMLSVVEQGDYDTIYVFHDDEDYPTGNRFNLGKGNVSRIVCVCTNKEVAKDWASRQVEALREQLDAWRKVEVPDEEIMSI